MDGVTTAIVLFVFVCVLFPRLIDNRPQYYAAFAMTLVIIVLTPLAALWGEARLVLLLVIAGLQAAAVLLLFLSAGGLTVRGLTSEMVGAFEVIRRGETEKEVLLATGNRERTRKTAKESIGQGQERIDLDTGGGDVYPSQRKQQPPPPPGAKKDDDGPIPME